MVSPMEFVVPMDEQRRKRSRSRSQPAKPSLVTLPGDSIKKASGGSEDSASSDSSASSSSGAKKKVKKKSKEEKKLKKKLKKLKKKEKKNKKKEQKKEVKKLLKEMKTTEKKQEHSVWAAPSAPSRGSSSLSFVERLASADSSALNQADRSDSRNTSGKARDWDCPKCGTFTFASKSNCFKCGTEREDGFAKVVDPTNWECPGCKASCRKGKGSCFKCGHLNPNETAGSQFRKAH